MNAWQRYAGVILLAIAGVVIQQSVFVLRLIEQDQPGSGFMPFGLGCILAVLAVCLIVTHRAPDERPVPFWEAGAWLRPLLAVALTAVYVVVFDDVGAITSVVVLVTAWLLIIARKRLIVAAATGLLTGLAVYLVFERLLQTPFPDGLLF